MPSLDTFTRAYIECALWSSHDTTDENIGPEPLDANHDESDLAPETLAKMMADCEAFQSTNAEALSESPGSSDQAGHDFWLTRCGHGTGFWDRDDNVWPQPHRDALDASARAFGNVDLYIGDDGQIYQ